MKPQSEKCDGVGPGYASLTDNLKQEFTAPINLDGKLTKSLGRALAEFLITEYTPLEANH